MVLKHDDLHQLICKNPAHLRGGEEKEEEKGKTEGSKKQDDREWSQPEEKEGKKKKGEDAKEGEAEWSQRGKQC